MLCVINYERLKNLIFWFLGSCVMGVFKIIIHPNSNNYYDYNIRWVYVIDNIVAVLAYFSLIFLSVPTYAYMKVCSKLVLNFTILNEYITNLKKSNTVPNLQHLEFIKEWYIWNHRRASEFDYIFNVQANGYVIFLFSAI